MLVVSLSYYPLVYLPDRGRAAPARLRGSRTSRPASAPAAWSTFFRVVLPAISPAVLGGALLVGLHLLGEYGALQLLNYPTLTTGILDQYRTTFNGPAATLLALVLVAFCLVLLGLELLARGRRRRARVGSGRRPDRDPAPARPRRARLASAGLVGARGAGPRRARWSAWSRWLVRGSSTSLPARRPRRGARTTLGLAVAGGLVATAGGAAGRLARGPLPRARSSTLVERSVYPANALPGHRGRAGPGDHLDPTRCPALYQTLPLLVLGYAILFLPRAVVERPVHPGAGAAGPRGRRAPRSAAPAPAPPAG